MSRRQEIVNLVQQHGFQSVATLAKSLDVTPSTIRRDLDRLSADGAISRTHGGAAAITAPQPAISRIREQRRADKAAIGAAMAERVLEGQTVIIDSGSTCLEVARSLRHERLTVVTHDLHVGLAISRTPQINLVFIGGELLPTTTSMWGPTSIQQLENLRVDVAIFGAETVMDGIYASTSYSIELKRKMRSIAGEAFFVADSSKFGREALFKVFELDAFTAGITDDALDPIRAATFPVPLILASARRESPVA